jgi:hypothetical protein
MLRCVQSANSVYVEVKAIRYCNDNFSMAALALAAGIGQLNKSLGYFLSTDPSLHTLAGMLVSHIWFSDHSVCYLELGSLAPGRVRRDGTTGNPVGEATIFLGYDWSANSAGSKFSRKYFHTHKEERDTLVARILGATIEFASLAEHDSEIEIGISTGVALISASAEGEEPDWNVGFNRYQDGCLRIEGGRLQFRIRRS